MGFMCLRCQRRSGGLYRSLDVTRGVSIVRSIIAYMKNIVCVLLFGVFLFLGVSKAEAYSYTRSYYRSNGTYVNSYYRLTPNRYKFDNYSSRGNSNPWTGSRGYKSWH